MDLPIAFQQQMQNLLGADYSAFVDSLNTPSKTSIRFNPLKYFKSKENSDGVKWNSNGVYLEKRPVFTLDPSFHAGAYYVQEASSMFLAEALKQCVDLNRDLKVLDLCAAPGGKSTLLASSISSNSILLANEVIRSRYGILKYNLTKWGYPNTHCSMHDSQDFSSLLAFFDVVVVDAPCSGEGLFRKDEKAIEEWSPNNVQLCAGRQKRILANAVQCISPGGILIYCTCTYNDLENVKNVQWMAEEFNLDIIPLKIPEDWHIFEKEAGYQFYPHLTAGEGFYICCLKKKDSQDKSVEKRRSKNKKQPKINWLSRRETELLQPWLAKPGQFKFHQTEDQRIWAVLKSQEEAVTLLLNTLNNCQTGIEIGTLKNKQLIPSPALALSTIIHPDLPTIELDKETALKYLKKETFPLEKIPEGWALMRYEGLNLGWIKGLRNRFNNYYPKEWRIRMRIE